MGFLPRALRRAFGEGALAGVAVGVVLGCWHVRLGGDLEHGFWWLAAERIIRPAALVGVFGVALSLALAGVTALLRFQDPRRRQTVAVVITGLAAISAITVFLTQNAVFPMAAQRGSPRLALAAVATCILGGLLLVGARLVDLLKDPDEMLPRYERRTMHKASAGMVLAVIVWGLVLAWPILSRYRAAGRPSVILVSLDTMRADRLGMLSGGPSLTPLLDEIAGEGLVFEQAQAAAPWTLPSHTSLFTSQMPFDHDVRWSWMRIAASQVMLAEHFRDAGYRTAAFTGGGYVAAHFGFDQGFTIYEDHDEMEENGPEGIAEAARTWVEANAGSPYFLFIHTYEPHSPFLRVDEVHDSNPGRLAAGVTFAEVEAIHDGTLVPTADEREFVTKLYDADIAHTDSVMGGLLKQLRDEGILDGAILVVLSDHGEDLWDHSDIRSPGHGHSLYQELIHVPLFVRAPGRVPAGHRLATPVSLLDVAPTLLAMADLAPDFLHEGRSLQTSLLTATEPTPAPVLAESVEYGPDRFMRRLGSVKVVLTPTPEHQHNHTHLKVAPLEIFDLALDPRERNNVASAMTAAPEDLTAAQRELIRQAAPLVLATRKRAERKLFGEHPPAGAEPDLPAELEEQLRSLGYIQ